MAVDCSLTVEEIAEDWALSVPKEGQRRSASLFPPKVEPSIFSKRKTTIFPPHNLSFDLRIVEIHSSPPSHYSLTKNVSFNQTLYKVLTNWKSGFLSQLAAWEPISHKFFCTLNGFEWYCEEFQHLLEFPQKFEQLFFYSQKYVLQS